MSNYYSRIRDIYIQIHNYDIFHGPTDYHKSDNRLIDRDILSNRLKSYLDTRKGVFSGVYLITGFRGIGKTSLVRKVLIEQLRKKTKASLTRLRIRKVSIAVIVALLVGMYAATIDGLSNITFLDEVKDYVPHLVTILAFPFCWIGIEWLTYALNISKEKRSRDHRIVELNLSQDRLNEFDVLRSIVWSVYDEYKESLLGTRFISKLVIVSALTGFSSFVAYKGYHHFGNPDAVDDKLVVLVSTIAIFFLSLLILYYATKWLFNNAHKVGFFTHRYILKRLSKLNDRINASLVEDERTSLKHFEFKLDFGGKAKNYDKVDAKEIEYELTQIFKQSERVHLGFSARRFVIVFDELDKVDFGKDFGLEVKNGRLNSAEPTASSSYYDFDPERRRREYIANLLSGLKHFFRMREQNSYL